MNHLLNNDAVDDRVCIIGLGYVGLTLAVALAEIGFSVLGIERDKTVIDTVRSGQAQFSEKGLDPRLKKVVETGRLKVTADWEECATSNVYIVTVGTPLNKEGATDLSSIKAVAVQIGRYLKNDELVILRSTVRIGVSREIVKSTLDVTGKQYDLAFCPERTIEGRAMEELRALPQIVGGIDQKSTIRAAQFFAHLTPTTIRVRSLETAEMIKLLNNTQRDLMFAFANEVAVICDAIGVSASGVIRAGNMGYARASMPLPGPVGGPCLEKDPYILAESVAELDGAAQLALLGRRTNERLPSYAIEQICEISGREKLNKVAIFGLAFKGRPETSDLRGTLALRLIADLRDNNPDISISGYDPALIGRRTDELDIEVFADPLVAAENADAIIFQNNNSSFEHLNMTAVSEQLKPGAIIYDLWSQFDPDILSLRGGVQYVALGSRCFHRQ